MVNTEKLLLDLIESDLPVLGFDEDPRWSGVLDVDFAGDPIDEATGYARVRVVPSGNGECFDVTFLRMGGKGLSITAVSQDMMVELLSDFFIRPAEYEAAMRHPLVWDDEPDGKVTLATKTGESSCLELSVRDKAGAMNILVKPREWDRNRFLMAPSNEFLVRIVSAEAGHVSILGRPEVLHSALAQLPSKETLLQSVEETFGSRGSAIRR